MSCACALISIHKDTDRIATGCQDGVMRVYHTARPDPNATEYNVAPSGIAEAITKLAWMPDENIIVVGQRSGKVQLWDVRTASGPAISVVVSKGGAVIQDLEINTVHNTILLATDDRVRFIPLPLFCLSPFRRCSHDSYLTSYPRSCFLTCQICQQ